MYLPSNISGTGIIRPSADTAVTNISDQSAVRFLAVLDQHPQLHLFGYGPARGMGIDVPIEHDALRQPFAVTQAADAATWIRTRLQPCSSGRKHRPTSYGAKHVMQAETGLYVLNGPFILAALAAGLRLDTTTYNPTIGAIVRPILEEQP